MIKTIAKAIKTVKNTSVITINRVVSIPASAKICNKECPATKFANSRIARLKSREINEIISITVKNGFNALGTFS